MPNLEILKLKDKRRGNPHPVALRALGKDEQGVNAQNVNEILDALAMRFGSTGVHLWGVLQRQAWVEFYVSLVGLAGALAVLAVGWKWMEESKGFLLVFGAALTIVALIFLGINATHAANPEYFALQKVLGALQ